MFGVRLQAKPSPMVHSLAIKSHQALLFVVLDAVHSEFIPTLHQQLSGLFHLPVSKLAPVMQTGSGLTGNEGSGRKIRVVQRGWRLVAYGMAWGGVR